MTLLIKILIIFGSSTSIVFGVWHFFVPKIWKWYSYIDQNAKELIIAVQAINVFFSLSLVLFGLMNIFLIIGNRANKSSLIIVLSTTCLLWLTRVIMQIIFPQGSINPILQYGMLVSFILVLISYLISLGIIISRNFS